MRVIVNEQVAKLTYERDAMVRQVNELLPKASRLTSERDAVVRQVDELLPKIRHIENVLEEGGMHVQWKTKIKGLR